MIIQCIMSIRPRQSKTPSSKTKTSKTFKEKAEKFLYNASDSKASNLFSNSVSIYDGLKTIDNYHTNKNERIKLYGVIFTNIALLVVIIILSATYIS